MKLDLEPFLMTLYVITDDLYVQQIFFSCRVPVSKLHNHTATTNAIAITPS